MTYDFSNPDLFNHIYLPLFYDDKRINVLYGGRDSGKSDFIGQKVTIDMLGNDFFRLILLRKYYAAIKQSQFQTIVDWIRNWELQNEFHITYNPLNIICKRNGNQILARGLDQPDNTKSIKDPTAIWYEEANQISEDAFTEASLSLRTSRNATLKEYISFNPNREQIWINRLFFPHKNTYERTDGRFNYIKSFRNDATILHTTYRDNRFISKDRIDRLESLKYQDENYYRVNTLGLWGGALKGLIYPEWTFVDNMPDGGDEVFGLDYGFNHASALVHESYKDGKLYVDELIYVTEHDHRQLVNLIVADFKNIIGKKLIIVDSAEPALIKSLRSAGFNAVPAAKGPNSVYDGILLVKQLPLNVTRRSSNIVTELEGYIWKEDRDGKLIDEPVKFDDHAMDAIRYPVQTYGRKHWFGQPKSTNNGYRHERRNRVMFNGF